MAKQKPSAVDPKPCCIALSTICGLHPTLVHLLSQLSIPPMGLACQYLSPNHLHDLLDIHPILITRSPTDVFCSGNIRLFQLIKSMLPDQALIPVREESAPAEKMLIRRTITEILFGNVLSFNHKEAKIIMAVALRAKELNYLEGSQTQLENLIASIYGVDRRTLKTKPTTTQPPLQPTLQETPHPNQIDPIHSEVNLSLGEQKSERKD